MRVCCAQALLVALHLRAPGGVSASLSTPPCQPEAFWYPTASYRVASLSWTGCLCGTIAFNLYSLTVPPRPLQLCLGFTHLWFPLKGSTVTSQVQPSVTTRRYQLLKCEAGLGILQEICLKIRPRGLIVCPHPEEAGTSQSAGTALSPFFLLSSVLRTWFFSILDLGKCTSIVEEAICLDVCRWRFTLHIPGHPWGLCWIFQCNIFLRTHRQKVKITNLSCVLLSSA